MSAQAIRYQERNSYGSWRYAVLALVAAIVITIAIVMANAGGTGQTTTGPTGSAQTAPHAPQTTIQVESGPAAGHPLP